MRYGAAWASGWAVMMFFLPLRPLSSAHLGRATMDSLLHGECNERANHGANNKRARPRRLLSSLRISPGISLGTFGGTNNTVRTEKYPSVETTRNPLTRDTRQSG